MPSIPIWSIVTLITSAVFIFGCLLIRLIRCRKTVLSTVDPTEYSDKKHGTSIFVGKTASPMSLSAPPSDIPSPIPSTFKSLSSQLHLPVGSSASESTSTANHAGKRPHETSHASQHHHIDHMPSPDTSLAFKDIELGTADINRTITPCKSGSTDDSGTFNQHDVVPTELSGTNNTMFTISNTFSFPKGRQKSLAMKSNVRHLFKSSTSLNADSDIHNAGSDTSLSPPPPPPVPPKDDAPFSPQAFSMSSAPLPSKMENNINGLVTINKDKSEPATSTVFAHRWKDEAKKEDPPTHPSLSLPAINANATIDMEPETRQLIAHDLDSMFAWSPVGDTDDASDHHSIHSILQSDANADIQSVTSGSVYRLVRNSTVLDPDRRSLAAQSIVSSVRPSLHDMASWWPIQDKVADQNLDSSEQAITTEANKLDPICLLSHAEIPAQDSLHALAHSNVVANQCMLSSCPPPRSTYSRTNLNKLKLALANENQNQEHAIESESESEQTEQELQTACQLPSTESQRATILDKEHSLLAIQGFSDAASAIAVSPPPSPTYPCDKQELFTPTITTKPSSAKTAIPSQAHSKIARARETASVSAAPQPVNRSPRSSTIGTGSSNRMDSVRRKPQSYRNMHRLSDQISRGNNSTRSSPSQAVYPPRSVNPRQLNQHLTSMSLQANGRSRHRPGLPIGFMNEESLVQDLCKEGEGEGPQPTVSFSSSTVRTMIPENEPIESHTSKKTTLTSIQQKQNAHPQLQYQKQQATFEQNHSYKRTTPTNQDQESQEQYSDRTLSAKSQQSQSIHWSSSNITKGKANGKTPAERERDRYLQSSK